jgi:hypothetical protein
MSLNTNKNDNHVLRYTGKLLKELLNANKTGHHVICYNWYIFESAFLLVFNDIFNNESGIV